MIDKHGKKSVSRQLKHERDKLSDVLVTGRTKVHKARPNRRRRR